MPLPACCIPSDRPDVTLGEIAYASYCKGGSDPARIGLTFDGKPCPTWNALGQNVNEKWQASAEAVVTDFRRRCVSLSAPAVQPEHETPLETLAKKPAAFTCVLVSAVTKRLTLCLSKTKTPDGFDAAAIARFEEFLEHVRSKISMWCVGIDEIRAPEQGESAEANRYYTLSFDALNEPTPMFYASIGAALLHATGVHPINVIWD